VPIRVALVDDHEMVRYGLHWSLEAEADMVVVGEAGTGEEAVRLAQEHRPDVMLLDVRLGDMDGPEVCRRVLAAAPGTAVIMLTSYAQEALILRSLSAGAKGYMIKDVELSELKAAIRAVHGGHSVLDPKITGSVIARATGRNAAAAGRPAIALSPLLSEQEATIVRYLADGLTVREVAERIQLSPHTVKDRLEKIRDKLAVRSRTAIVAEAVRRGLV